MMDKDKLRKADIFSGSLIVLFGIWVVSQALKMPMKGSWGGVQNVWFVSPALFPLFVGAMITLLGALLMRTALKAVGLAGLRQVLQWMASRELLQYLQTPAILRFYAMLVLFFSYVFLAIPRVDFFACSLLFLMAFISMFYFDDDVLLKKLFFCYLALAAGLLLFFVFKLPQALEGTLPYAGDWLTLICAGVYSLYTWRTVRGTPRLRKKYRLSLILAVAAPFSIGPVFKYFLLVPMPTEGLVVAVMDAIWYWDF
ncbi:MAG: hypothetical protein QNJ01_07855 [Desulfobacterales bacterium]|nr:hypothetical protein [Desulfobacterales bacterium]